MVGYLVRRMLQSLLFVIICSFIIYTAVVYMPGGPEDYYNISQNFGINDPTSQDYAPYVYADYYEVDKPWPVSYFAWLFDPNKTMEINDKRQEAPVGIDITIGPWRLRGTGVLVGDFGRVDGPKTNSVGNIERGPTVTSQIAADMGNTVLVVGLAVLLSLLVAIPLGIIVSARPGGALDRAVTFVSSLTLSLPLYGLAYLLIAFLAVIPYYLRTQVGWSWMPNLPGGGTYTDIDKQTPIDRLYYAALPAMTLALPQIAIISKYVRVSMLEVLGFDYIRTAWAKGLPKWRIFAKHAFRNALLPTITVIGLVLPAIASGAIVVEFAFDYRGLGYLAFKALGGVALTEDSALYPSGGGGLVADPAMLMALLLLLVAVIAIANVMADIMYMVVDPRVEYSGHKSRQ